MSLHALVEKWRAEAKELRERTLFMSTASGMLLVRKAKDIEERADELAAALAGGVEAVAWIKPEHLANLHKVPQLSRTMNVTPLSAQMAGDRTVPLFTNPAGDVQVTDGVVAWWNGQRPTNDGLCIPSISWDGEDAWHDIPLYSHPNPANSLPPAIDDEIIERALAAYFDNDESNIRLELEHEAMRRALTAALNPGGSRE